MDFYKVVEYLDKNKDNKIVTILTGKHVGAKLVLSDGDVIYKEGQGVKWQSIRDALPLDLKTQILTIDGEKIFIEALGQSYKVVLCGAGHVGLSVLQLCKILELPVTVIDDRPSFTNKAIKLGADHVICQPFVDALNKIPGDQGTFFVIVTRGHRYDQICLEHIIEKENGYIGMIGSKVRARNLLNALEEAGIERKKLDKVYTPIGLKIGAETPAEIAVAIIAEMIEVKSKGKGKNMYSKPLLKAILDDHTKDRPKALVTIVSRKGSAPREVGTKMLVLADGTVIGTIGGGCVEANLKQRALDSIAHQKPQLLTVDMTGRDAEEEGMVCGGIIEAFIEPILSSK